MPTPHWLLAKSGERDYERKIDRINAGAKYKKEKGHAIDCQDVTDLRKTDYPAGVRFYHLHVIIR